MNNQGAAIAWNYFVSGWGVILAQFGLHAIELSNVGFFKCSGFFASESHHQENEAVFGDLVHRAFFAFGVSVGDVLKIEGVKFR
ncbi:Uncharacterised protein [Shigella sonnei]|nr:Uncharacterised protein [Shigella sonnei]